MSTAHSQDPGPGHCAFNVTVSQNFQTVFVSPGTVCFQCDFGNGVATDSTFVIDNSPVDSSEGTTVMGVLVIFDSEQGFETSSARIVRCESGGSVRNAITFLESELCCVMCTYMYV